MQSENKLQLEQAEFEINLYFSDKVRKVKLLHTFGKDWVIMNKLEVLVGIISQKRLSNQIMRSLC